MRDNFLENISRTFSIPFPCGWKDVIRKGSFENIFEALWGAEWTENTWLAKMGIYRLGSYLLYTLYIVNTNPRDIIACGFI